jgi:hypothetical protein
LVLDARPRDAGVDVEAIEERLRLTPDERIQLGLEEAQRNIEETRHERQN